MVDRLSEQLRERMLRAGDSQSHRETSAGALLFPHAHFDQAHDWGKATASSAHATGRIFRRAEFFPPRRPTVDGNSSVMQPRDLRQRKIWRLAENAAGAGNWPAGGAWCNAECARKDLEDEFWALFATRRKTATRVGDWASAPTWVLTRIW